MAGLVHAQLPHTVLYWWKMTSSSNSSLQGEETEPGHTGGQEVVVIPLQALCVGALTK